MAKQVRGLRVVFTLNNFTSEEQEQISSNLSQLEQDGKLAYASIGEEAGAKDGTIHLQGFARLARGAEEPRKCGISTWKRILGNGRVHLETARGSDQDNKEYTQKDGIYREWGEIKEESQSVYAECISSIGQDLKQTVVTYPELAIKHYGNIAAIRRHFVNREDLEVPEELYPWQKLVVSKLLAQDGRKILFCIDEVGGRGKSALCKWLIRNQGAWACQGGKITDLMHTYDVGAPLAVFDMARCNSPDYWPWNFMENLKNGWFTSTKYNGAMTIFKPPSILVLCNEDVPRNKLSQDRYDVFFLKNFI